MKNKLIILSVFALTISVYAYDINSYRNASQSSNTANNQQKEQTAQPEMREIKNLNEYFRYLPHEVNRNWTPYKANTDYTVTVRFTINRDGSISGTRIVKSTNENANTSVLNAVKTGAPYQPLPSSYSQKSVTAEIELEYRK